MPGSSSPLLCRVATVALAATFAWHSPAQSPEKEPVSLEEMNKHDYVQRRAESCGGFVVPDMPMTVVVLPLEYLNSDSWHGDKAARRLLRRHPSAPKEVKFWQPDMEKARAAFTKVMAQAGHETYKRLEKPENFACQVFGLEEGKQKLIVCNFVLEERRKLTEFCVRPDAFHDLRWPYGGTVILDEKNNIVSISQKLDTDQP